MAASKEWSLVKIIVIDGADKSRSEKQTEKEFWSNLLLEKLIEIIPGRYKIRQGFIGKKNTTFRYTKSCDCTKQWKFTAISNDLSESSVSFDLYENHGVCSHELEVPRPRELKGIIRFSYVSNI